MISYDEVYFALLSVTVIVIQRFTICSGAVNGMLNFSLAPAESDLSVVVYVPSTVPS